MSRYIKFDDAVKVMACEMYAEAQSQGYDVDGIEDFMPEAKAWLNDAPSIEIPQWIPCSERLPEENVAVLTQAKFKDDIKMAVSARQDYNYWTGWGTREVNIVAWMPLPEP